MVAAPLRAWARALDPTAGAPLDDLRFGVPVTRDRVRSPDGAELDLVVAGDPAGALVVLSHCWTGDRRVWGPVARRLAVGGHRVALYDQRGHGASTVGDAGLTLDALAEDLAAVLDHVGAQRAVVGGHSMGGMALQALAARRGPALGERVGAAVLVATAATALARGPRFRAGPRVVGSRHAERLLGHPVLGPFAVRAFVGRRPCLSHLRAISETFLATPAAVRSSLLDAMFRMQLTGALAGTGIPVTVVVGSADRHTTPRHARQIADSVPGARLVVVPDAGHMLPWEAPDLVARLVAEATCPPVPGSPPADRPSLTERSV